MGTLSVAHLYRQITNYGVHAVDFSGLVKTTLIFAEGCANCSCQHKQGDLCVISANNPGDQHFGPCDLPLKFKLVCREFVGQVAGIFPFKLCLFPRVYCSCN